MVLTLVQFGSRGTCPELLLRLQNDRRGSFQQQRAPVEHPEKLGIRAALLHLRRTLTSFPTNELPKGRIFPALCRFLKAPPRPWADSFSTTPNEAPSRSPDTLVTLVECLATILNAPRIASGHPPEMPHRGFIMPTQSLALGSRPLYQHPSPGKGNPIAKQSRLRRLGSLGGKGWDGCVLHPNRPRIQNSTSVGLTLGEFHGRFR